jgi:hypothetical protein
MGKFIEHVCLSLPLPLLREYDADQLDGLQYHRTIPFDAILGGTEDVLADLGVRQAMRHMPKNVRL